MVVVQVTDCAGWKHHCVAPVNHGIVPEKETVKPNVCRHASFVALERVNVTGEWYHVVVDWYCPWLCD